MELNRRRFLRWLAGTGASLMPAPRLWAAPAGRVAAKPIPATGETLPVIGMGTWKTFDVYDYPFEREQRLKVLQAFFDMGGALVDSSPMYGSSERTLGYCLERIANRQRLFAATKVWTYGQARGISQMARSRSFWNVARFDLMQVHNLLDWEGHLETLREWKAAGKIRYLGVTTSHGRRHEELEQLLRHEALDFVQFTYNVIDREAEQRLLPLAAERGVAVIANRPFMGGALFRRVRGSALPGWAGEFGCNNWAQFFLKYAVSHPAVTCAIPATSKLGHMVENMGAAYGPLPDAATREKMARLVAAM